MNNNSIKQLKSKDVFKRKLKCLGNCVDTNNFTFHPITLNLIKNNLPNKICSSELHFINGDIKYTKSCSSDNKISSNDIQKFMALPYLNLSSEQMLSIYKIDTIDNMINWIKDKIQDDMPFQYVNRIINIWIKYNYNDFVKNNSTLVNLYNILNSKYWFLELSNLDKYIVRWFKNKDYNDFSFNLGGDIYRDYKS